MNLIPYQNPIYRILDPQKSNYVDYQKYIEKLPTESPQMFGMHPNAEINYLTTQGEYVFENIVDMQGASSSSGDGEDGGIAATVQRFKETIPESFNMLKIQDVLEAKNAAGNASPYDTVVMQECTIMNNLLKKIFGSLEELELGLAGALNMTGAMENLAEALNLNRVPGDWGKFYLSKKPLSSWYADLAQRCGQFYSWTAELQRPKSVCISWLFNPMSFLTAIIQVTARMDQLPLDEMCTQTKVSSILDYTSIKSDPDTGCYVHGLFLEGAAWENGQEDNEGYLIEQRLKELHPPLPVVNVQAVMIKNKKTKAQYTCPVYYTTMRGPAYRFTANLNMESDEVPQSKWILSGTCLIMNEDF